MASQDRHAVQQQHITGNRPHIGYRAVADSHLRQHPLVVPLPPVKDVSPRSYSELRCIRQHSRTWDALHDRRVTTSRLAAALGFYEKDAAARLGVPRSLAGHSKAVSVYLHLTTDGPNPAPALLAGVAAGPVPDAARRPVSLVAAAGLEELTPAFIAAALRHSGDAVLAVPASAAGLSIAVPAAGGAGGRDDAAATAAVPLSPGSASGLWRLSHTGAHRPAPGPTPGPFLYQYFPKRPVDDGDHSPWAGPEEGTGGVRMQWGSVQESTGVLAAVNALVATEVARALQADKDAGRATGKGKGKSSTGGSAAAGPASPASASSASAVMLHSRLLECGLCCGECVDLPPGCSVDRASLPLLGASPDAVVVYGSGRVEAVEVKSHSPFQDNDGGRWRGGGSRGGGAGIGYGSPVAPSIPSASSYSHSHAFALIDRGPQDSIGPWHVPQLQMEAYCLGPHCAGTNFVSVSATRGARVFWVPRDDTYISLMLSFVARFNKDFVSKKREPPVNFWTSDPQHRVLVQETLRIAREAVVRVELPDDAVQRSPHCGHFFQDNRAAVLTGMPARPSSAAPATSSPFAGGGGTGGSSLSTAGLVPSQVKRPGTAPAGGRPQAAPAATGPRTSSPKPPAAQAGDGNSGSSSASSSSSSSDSADLAQLDRLVQEVLHLGEKERDSGSSEEEEDGEEEEEGLLQQLLEGAAQAEAAARAAASGGRKGRKRRGRGRKRPTAQAPAATAAVAPAPAGVAAAPTATSTPVPPQSLRQPLPVPTAEPDADFPSALPPSNTSSTGTAKGGGRRGGDGGSRGRGGRGGGQGKQQGGLRLTPSQVLKQGAGGALAGAAAGGAAAASSPV